MLSLILNNLSVLFVTLTPLFAFLFCRLTYSGWHHYLLILCSLLGVGLVTAIIRHPTISSYCWIYATWTIFAMTVHGAKYTFKHPWKLFGLSLLLAFFAANFWEIPVYVYGALGIEPFTKWFDWYYQIHNIYMVVVFCLYMKVARVRVNIYGVFLLISALLGSAIVLYARAIADYFLLARLIVLFCMFGLIDLGFDHETNR